MRSVDRYGPTLIDYRWDMPQCFCTKSANFCSQNFVLICAKDQQVVLFVIFDEALESTSCFVINGDNGFDPYRVHHFSI
jgi:hypothetical protein